MKIIDKHTKCQLSDTEILDEANRDHTSEFSFYTIEDLKTNPEEVLEWIDPQYFEITL